MARKRGKGEGSIYERADGRWAASVDLGVVDGKRTRKTFYGATRKAVAAKLAGALGKQQAGELVATNDRLTVDAYLSSWLSTVSVRPKTKRQYEQVVRLYLTPALGARRLVKLEPGHVREMCKNLEARLATRTATLSRDVLRIALNQAVHDGLLARNVATLVRRPKPQRRDGPTLTADEARALLNALAGRRLEGIVTVAVALGLRLGEVLGMEWKNVDLQAKRLTVRRAMSTTGKVRELVDLKSRESHRTLAIPGFVVDALAKHRRRQAEQRLAAGADWQASDLVFTTRTGRGFDGTLVSRDVRTVVAKTWTGGAADCPHTRVKDRACLDCQAIRLPSVTFHGLRHSCASLLLSAGVPIRDVSELLGHSDTRLTLQTYAHVLDANRARLAGVIDSVFDSRSDSQTNGRGQTQWTASEGN
jgi:integrase